MVIQLLLLYFAIVNTIVYLKNKETRKLKAMATWEICIEYLLIGVQTSATFISYAIINDIYITDSLL